MEFNFPADHEFTRQELRQFHHLCRLRNLDMTPSNYNIWQGTIFLFHYLGKVSECVPNLSIQIQALDLNDVQGALKLISNYYHEWQGPEIYAKALEIDTIQIHPGWNILDLMEVIQVAKKEAKVVGRPIDTQLLKYLFLRGVYATHNKYWEELNNWLNDKNLNELEMSTLYQELVLRKHEVELEQKFKGPTPTNNNLAMQLYAKVHSRSTLKSDIMMAIKGSNEANIAHVANYGDLCRHPLCRGKRNSAKHLWSECRRNPNNLQNKLRHNNDRSKFDRGIKNGIRTNSGGNNFPGSSNIGSNNIINSGFKQDRVGGKPNFRSNSNYRGSERRDGKSINNSRGDSK